MKNRKLFLFAAVFLMFNFFAVAQTIAPAEDQQLYTKQDIKFELLIPNASANTVQVLTPNLPHGVNLKTMKKSEQYGEVIGTLIELWFNFDKTGTYELPRLSVLVQNRRKYYYFEEVKITENPANMLPKIIVEFENGTVVKSGDAAPSKAIFSSPAGSKIKFKVNIQYATQLVQFNWDIPKDSIFTQTETYEIMEIKYREKNYSDELIPVADFEWIPLSKGLNAMPKIRLTATGYNGYRNELTLPNVSINITTGASQESADAEDQDIYFEAAFESLEEVVESGSVEEISLEDCQQIVELRHKEKNNFFTSHKYRKQRIELEKTLGMASNTDEFWMGFFYLSIFLLVVLAGLTVLIIRKRKTSLLILMVVFVIFGVIGLVYSLNRMSHSYGISTNCTLRTIPEESSVSIGKISAGNRVAITEKAGDWYYVEIGTISGWTNKSEILE